MFGWMIAVTLAQVAPTASNGAVAAQMLPGTVVVQSENSDYDLVEPFEVAVQNALEHNDFLVLPGTEHSRYVARIDVTRKRLGLATSDGKEAKPTTRIGNWGGGAQITLPSAKREVHDLVLTTLTITIGPRNSEKAAWSGIASTAQIDGTSRGDPQNVGVKLATAILAQFPAPFRSPLTVP